MKITVQVTPLKDLKVVEIDYFEDERGFFVESWSKKTFEEAGIVADFVQDSHSKSKYGVLRGLHFQNQKAPLAKLVRCTRGKIFDVALDLRASSPSLAKWFSVELSEENKKELFIPEGFAHGFQVLTDFAEVEYKQTGFYNPSEEGTINYNDPTLAINWPISEAVLSERDKNGMSFEDYLKNPAF